MLYRKQHKTEQGLIVALCDEELLGTAYKEGKLVLDLKKYAGFYRGELEDEKSAEKALKDANIFSANVVGKRSVDVFKRLGFVSDGDVKTIQGVQFVQIFNTEM